MIHSIFKIGKAVVRRIIPFGTTDDEDDLENPDKPVEDKGITSVDTFLENFRKLSSASPFTVDTSELERTVSRASQEWFSILVSRNGLLSLLNATSTEAQRFLNDAFFGNKKFFDAILANPSIAIRQLAAGVKESAVMRHHVYLLLVMLGMYSYEGYVLVYKTANLLQRERPGGMFQYIAEEIAATTDESAQQTQSTEHRLEFLIPPLALMAVLFAGGNGFFIESHLRHQIQGSKLLTSLVDVSRKNWLEEKRSRKSELPTLKEPSTRDCTPQINRAVEILEEAERSSDKILVWLDKLDTSHTIVPAPAMKSQAPSSSSGVEAASKDGSEYVLQLGPEPNTAPKIQPQVSMVETIVLETQTSVPAAVNSAKAEETTPADQANIDELESHSVAITTQTSESLEKLEVKPSVSEKASNTPNLPVSLTSPPSVVTFDQFIAGAAAAISAKNHIDRQQSNVSGDVNLEVASSPSAAGQQKATEVEVTSPPSGVVPPAPPPPPPMEMLPNGLMVAAGVPRSHMKPLRWTKLDTTPDVVEGTVWDVVDVSVDTSNLDELFHLEKNSGKYQVDAGHHNTTGDAINSIISPQTELHINVILKQFPDIEPEELAQRIQSLAVDDFDESQLKELMAAIPSDQEFHQIENLKSSQEPLKPAETFLLSLLAVDHLKLRLEVMHLVTSFPVTARSILHNCDDIGKTCEIIRSSDGFRKFLQLVLKVGNKMNEGRAIGAAVAFDTTILPKLSEVGSNQPGVSLLHFLVERVQEDDPMMLHFLEEFEPLLTMAETPLNQMKAEVIAAKIKYGQLREEIQEMSGDGQSGLFKLLQTVKGRVNSANTAVSRVVQDVQNLAAYLMEDPGEFQIHGYIEMLKMFMQSVQTILHKPARHDTFTEGVGSPKTSRREQSVPKQVPPPAYAAPMMNDPRFAGVLQSLRNELKTTMASNQSDEWKE
ncbi:hypothetical protein RvY_05052-2 [Ramazzottius varieornatus]|uniref:FH2 domain-containing protein n=1 Tax=Ramazzottius varieornatus TaxID=947166 RepID=A0A1D1UZG9_RAMVA|nr:hypothetical protein RvY_05052-2 [Ramazzottius varieornatus]